MTLSGAKSGTFDCTPAYSVWQSAENRGGFAFSLDATAAHPQILMGVTFSGEPHPGTYRSSDPDAGGGAIVVDSGDSNVTWGAFGVRDASPQGTYGLTLTAVGLRSNSPDGKGYVVHGAMDARLIPGGTSTATGTITLHATF